MKKIIIILTMFLSFAVLAETDDDILKNGVDKTNEKKYPEAIKIMENYVAQSDEKNPNLSEAHHILAMLYYRTKDYEKCLAEWKKVLVLTKDEDLIAHAKKHIKQLSIAVSGFMFKRMRAYKFSC